MSTLHFRVGCILVWSCCASLADADEATLVIENVQVIIGDGSVRKAASVVIQGKRIQNVLDTSPTLPSAKTIDGRNMTLMPGVIDTHIHIFGGSFTGNRGFGEKALRDELANEVPGRLKEYLRHGVTTVYSTGDPLVLIVELRDQLKSGKLKGPRLLVVGPGFTATDGHPASTLLAQDPWWRSQHTVEVDDPEEARKHVRRVAAKGVDAVKLVYHAGPYLEYVSADTKMEKLRPDVMQAIIEEAHRQNLRARVHTWREQDAVDVLQAGSDGLEHGVDDALLTDDRLAELLCARNAFYVPTLRILSLAKTPETLPIGKQNLKRLAEKGVRIALGTDSVADLEGTPPGLNTIKEMELMVEAGLNTAAVIRAATRDAAEYVGLLKDIGTVEAGKLADLIIVDGDPLQDITVMEKVRLVVQAGRIVYDANSR